MLMRRNVLKLIPVLAGLLTANHLTSSKHALGQVTGSTGPVAPSIEPSRIAAGEVDVKQLLLLMDADKNGKISRKEFMDFMQAEFDRLDTDKSGELDIKELEKSQLTTTHHGGTHR